MTLLILLTGGTILIATWIAGNATVNDLSKAIIARVADSIEADLETFFGSVRSSVRIGRDWAESGLVDATDVNQLNSLFVPILEQHPQLSSMMVATSNGVEYLLLRDALNPNVWTNRLVRADDWGQRVLNRTWNSSTGAREEEFGELDYDPRRRIWYQMALETRPGRDIAWTKPVIFFITKDPGITAATHTVITHGSPQTCVIAFDLLLMDISRFTTRHKVSENGMAFVVVEGAGTTELQVIGLPRREEYADAAAIREALIFVPPESAVADSEARLPPVEELGIPALNHALQQWSAASNTIDPFRFKSDGLTWWGGMRPFPLGEQSFWIGVIVPTRDLVGNIETTRRITIVISIAALLAAIVMAVVMARNYGKPLEALAGSSLRIRELDLEHEAAVESPLAEINQLADAQTQMLAALQSFSRYVPVDLVRELLKRGEVAQIGGRRESLTILFTDIRDFTTVAENTTPEQLATHMAEYFSEMLEVLQDFHATVDKFVGDALVAFWNAPNPTPDHATHAVAAVLACRERIADCNRSWVKRGLPSLPTRFGLALGEVVVGNIGAETRLSYTALGDTVNLAARLEGLNRVYGTEILVSEPVRDATGARFDWRFVDLVAVKGKAQAMSIYEPLDLAGTVDEATREFARNYERAWEMYRARRFADAADVLRRLQAQHGDEVSVMRLLNICERYLRNPPASDWDGVARMTEK